MAVNKTSLNISELDYDTIKANLKSFLEDQTELADYDFSGSVLNTLLNVLSYNTYINAFYNNMTVNEAFLDSAQLRANIVSKAKELGYIPRSVTGATAVIDLTIAGTATSDGQITVPKYTQFSTIIDSNTYTFNTLNALNIIKDVDNEYTKTSIDIKEGTPITHRHSANSFNADQKFSIPNFDIDTSTLTIEVENSLSDSTSRTFISAGEFNTITGTDLVYWLVEGMDGYYEIQFGDDVVGKDVDHGNIIISSYLISNKDQPNKASTFIPVSDISGFSEGITVTLDTAAYGGADRESNSSIRFLSPKIYEAQNRAVTAADYRSILLRDYTNIDSISVWGGEDNIPPVYGSVYISLNPTDGYVISDTTKEDIAADILKKRNVVTVTPVFVDPYKTYLEITSTVKYNSRNTTKTGVTLKNEVLSAITSFNTNELGEFEAYFKYSQLTGIIDDVDTAIENNLTEVKMINRFTPTLNLTAPYSITFNNSLEHPYTGFLGAVTSTKFMCTDSSSITQNNCHFADNGTGVMTIISTDIITGIESTIESNTGTVDYDTGELTLNDNFFPLSYTGTYIELKATPDVFDIVPTRNQLIVIDSGDVTLSMYDASTLTTTGGL